MFHPNPRARSVPESTLCETLRHWAAEREIQHPLWNARRKRQNGSAGRRSFAYSALACFRMGMSGSASFQREEVLTQVGVMSASLPVRCQSQKAQH